MPGEQGAIERIRSALTATGCDRLPNAWIRKLALEKKSDEELVWVARPADSYGRTEQAAWVTGVALLFWLAAQFGEVFSEFAPGEWSNWFLPVVSLITFVFLALCVWLGPRWNSSRTLYVLTNQRAILMRFGMFFSIRTFALKDIRKFTRFELDDGNGDLVFERFSFKDEDGNLKTGENGFYGIAEVRQVEKMLQAVIDQKESNS